MTNEQPYQSSENPRNNPLSYQPYPIAGRQSVVNGGTSQLRFAFERLQYAICKMQDASLRVSVWRCKMQVWRFKSEDVSLKVPVHLQMVHRHHFWTTWNRANSLMEFKGFIDLIRAVAERLQRRRQLLESTWTQKNHEMGLYPHEQDSPRSMRVLRRT